MKVKAFNFDKGRNNENIAKIWLEDKNYKYIESNYQINIGEIDLIMSDDDWLVFIEVKFKTNIDRGFPEEMIDKRKMYQIKKVAEVYLLNNRSISKRFSKYRIDAICTLGNKIKHYKNIYE